MSSIEVVTADIRSSATKTKQAADGVKAADASGSVGPVAGALVGSSSASASASLQRAWRSRFSSWHTDAADQHERLSASADDYDASDHRAAETLDQTSPHMRGRPVVG